jgi:hypothetical protein
MKLVLACLAFLVASTPSAFAQGSSTRGSQNSSNASAASLAASGFVVAGSAELIASGAQLTIMAIQATGETVVIVMRGASEAATVSVRTSAKLAQEASAAVGTAVRVVAESVGFSLYVGARLIAFVPNEIGRALIHQSVRDGSAK